jgi:hypothetical protein
MIFSASTMVHVLIIIFIIIIIIEVSKVKHYYFWVSQNKPKLIMLVKLKWLYT